MSVTIKIGSTIIDFPSTGNSPVWSDAVVQFAQTVESALRGVFGAYDVPPQVLSISTPNDTNGFQSINALNFPPSQVLQFQMEYAVFRKTDDTTMGSGDGVTLTETGTIDAIYNDSGLPYDPMNPNSGKWEVTRQAIGDAEISFVVLDNGQVQYDTNLIPGINHTGKIVFSAKALLQA